MQLSVALSPSLLMMFFLSSAITTRVKERERKKGDYVGKKVIILKYILPHIDFSISFIAGGGVCSLHSHSYPPNCQWLILFMSICLCIVQRDLFPEGQPALIIPSPMDTHISLCPLTADTCFNNHFFFFF